MIILPGGPNVKEPTEYFIRRVQSKFDFRLDMTGRVTLRADVNQFKWKEDESVWEQARDKAPNVYEVYWDDVWVCDFNERENPDVVDLRFLKGFTKLYEEGKVTLNTKEELDKHRQKETAEELIQKEIRRHREKAKTAKTKEDAIVQEVIADTLEEKTNYKQKKK